MLFVCRNIIVAVLIVVVIWMMFALTMVVQCQVLFKDHVLERSASSFKATCSGLTVYDNALKSVNA